MTTSALWHWPTSRSRHGGGQPVVPHASPVVAPSLAFVEPTSGSFARESRGGRGRNRARASPPLLCSAGRWRCPDASGGIDEYRAQMCDSWRPHAARPGASARIQSHTVRTLGTSSSNGRPRGRNPRVPNSGRSTRGTGHLPRRRAPAHAFSTKPVALAAASADLGLRRGEALLTEEAELHSSSFTGSTWSTVVIPT